MIIAPNRFRDTSVLVAALNWGLGHATRCIPLIRQLLSVGAKVTLASDGRALELWRQEFPALQALQMPAYNIRYPSANMMWNMFWQAPKIQWAIRQEHAWITKQFRKTPFDFILSDNRFGCYHPDAFNIFMTHQLNIQTAWPRASRFVNTLNHRMIRRFNECWVPDWEAADNLSGILAHGEAVRQANLPPIKYLGPLSRFNKLENIESEKKKQSYRAIAILSGPEPQRTYLEQELLRQMNKIPGQFVLVQGKTESRRKITQRNVDIISFMTGTELFEAIARSEIIICRSGYSSIMDLARLEKKAILIPTPGQTEQEYLSSYLKKRNQFVTMMQGEISLENGIKKLFSQ